jgi:S-methylmethionine-dependent homocysteine/selenocysteine methylase
MAGIDVFLSDIIENLTESSAIKRFVEEETAPCVLKLDLNTTPQGIRLGDSYHHVISIDAYDTMDPMMKT